MKSQLPGAFWVIDIILYLQGGGRVLYSACIAACHQGSACHFLVFTAPPNLFQRMLVIRGLPAKTQKR